MKKENLAALEIRHLCDSAVGIRHFGKVDAGKRGIEFRSGFYFWKLNESEIKLTCGCDERLKEKKKGGKAVHATGFIPV